MLLICLAVNSNLLLQYSSSGLGDGGEGNVGLRFWSILCDIMCFELIAG